MVEKASSSVSGSSNLGRFVAFELEIEGLSLALVASLSHGSVLGIMMVEDMLISGFPHGNIGSPKVLSSWQNRYTVKLQMPDTAGGERAE